MTERKVGNVTYIKYSDEERLAYLRYRYKVQTGGDDAELVILTLADRDHFHEIMPLRPCFVPFEGRPLY